MPEIQYELLYVSWKEMTQAQAAGIVSDHPVYYAVDPNGSLRIWPPFNHDKRVPTTRAVVPASEELDEATPAKPFSISSIITTQGDTASMR